MPKPSKTGKLPSTARSLPIALIRAREKVMSPIREMLSENKITEQQWRVLRVLSEFGAMDATEVGDHAGLHLPSLTRILRTLSERGFLSRTQDEIDRRRQVLVLTAEGQAVIDGNMEHAARIVTAYKEDLGEENYEQLLDLLGKLTSFKFP